MFLQVYINVLTERNMILSKAIQQSLLSAQEQIDEIPLLLETPANNFTAEQQDLAEHILVRVMAVVDSISRQMVATTNTQPHTGTRGCYDQLQKMGVIDAKLTQKLQTLNQRRNMLLFNFTKAGCRKHELMEKVLVYKGLENIKIAYSAFCGSIDTWEAKNKTSSNLPKPTQ